MAVIPNPPIAITWPRSPRKPWRVLIHDMETGREYSSVTLAVTVMVDPTGGVNAELLMLTDAFGNIAGNDTPTALLTEDGGGYRKDTFYFPVAQMRLLEE